MSAQALHQKLVADLVAKGASTKRFAADVVRAVCGSLRPGDDENCDHLREFFADLRIIPDAFIIKPDTLEVFAFEVEVANGLDDEKIERYTQWWWALDESYWMLRLIIVHRLGKHIELDLFANDCKELQLSPQKLAAHRKRMGIRKPGDPPDMDLAAP